MKIVIRVGGSVVASPLNSGLIAKYVSLLKVLRAQGHELVVVVGGGVMARDFIRVADELGLDEPNKDWAAIFVSRLIALLFVMRLGKIGCGTVPVSLDEVAEHLRSGNVVVMGGLKPGMTTDAVAALVAEKVKAKLLVKATDQNGIFTKDPRKHPDAKKIDRLSFNELHKLFELDKHRAGIHLILDPEAVRILQKSKTKTVVVNGFKPRNLLSAVSGKEVGTVIS